MKNKLLLIIISIPLLMGCLKKEKYEEYPVDLCSINTSLLDNTYSNPEISYEDTLRSKAFGMRLGLNFTHSGSDSCEMVFETSYNKVYLQNKVQLIEIITNTDFDQYHLAGSNIVDYFSVYRGHNYVGLKDYYNDLPRINTTDFPLSEQMDALLMHLPENAGDYQFTTRFYMIDGSVIESVSPQVHLLP